MFKLFVLTLIFIIPIFVQAQEIIEESKFKKICESKGFLKKYGSSLNCINSFSANNKKVQYSNNLTKDKKNMKQLYEAHRNFILKNNIKLNEDFFIISRKLNEKQILRLGILLDLFKRLKESSYSDYDGYSISSIDNNNKIIVRGPESIDEMKNYIMNYNKLHIEDKLNLKRFLKSVSKEDKIKKIDIYNSLLTHIENEKFLIFEKKAIFYESFKFFKGSEEVNNKILSLLMLHLNKESNPVLRLAIYNTILYFDNSKIKLIEPILLGFNKYIESFSFENDFITPVLLNRYSIVRTDILKKDYLLHLYLKNQKK